MIKYLDPPTDTVQVVTDGNDTIQNVTAKADTVQNVIDAGNYDECQWKELTSDDAGQQFGDDTGDEILEKNTYPD